MMSFRRMKWENYKMNNAIQTITWEDEKSDRMQKRRRVRSVNSKSFTFGSEFMFSSLKKTESDPIMKLLLFTEGTRSKIVLWDFKLERYKLINHIIHNASTGLYLLFYIYISYTKIERKKNEMKVQNKNKNKIKRK